MEWWLWAVAGVACLIFEILTPGGFVVFFFGLGGIVTAAFVGARLGGPLWFQILLWIVSSVALLLLFRGKVLHLLGPKPGAFDMDSMVGTSAVAHVAIPAGGRGKVEARGSSWDAINEGHSNLEVGARGKVVKVEGLILHVKGE